MSVNDDVYDYLSKLSKKEYKEYKENLGNTIKNEIASYFDLLDEEIELIDVSTPLTYERYTNAYRGSYMSFLTTKKVKGIMRVGLIKGLKNFALAGQWIIQSGGLPAAAISGKYAAQRICKSDKKKFVEFD